MQRWLSSTALGPWARLSPPCGRLARPRFAGPLAVAALGAVLSSTGAGVAHAQLLPPEATPPHSGPALPRDPDVRTVPSPYKPAEAQPPQASSSGGLAKGGIPIGSFLLDAGGEVSQALDDNIFSTQRGPVRDWITTVSPFVNLESNWSRHSLSFSAGADIGRYKDHKSENFEDYTVGGDGRYDLGGGSTVFGGGRFTHSHESRESPDNVNGTEPTVYRDIETYVGTLQRFGDTSLRVGSTWERLDFSDVPAAGGLPINNDDRDRNIFDIGTRLGYRLTQTFEPFVQGSVNWRRYDQHRDDFGFDRDSEGVGLAAGTRFFFGAGTEGEVLVGYMGQYYADPTLADVSTYDIGGRLSWKLAPNTKTTVFLDRAIAETTIPGASAYVDNEAGIEIEHWIARDLMLSTSASFIQADFQGVERQDDLVGLGAGIKYFVTPNVFIGSDYRFIRRSSNIATANFDDNQFFMRIGGQLANGYHETAAAKLQDSGLYAGAQFAFGQLTTDLEGPRGSGGTLSSTFGNSGFGGGGFVGYGVTNAPWYFGVELELEDSEANWDHARSPGGRIFGVAKGATYGGALRFGRWLPYGALAYGRVGVVHTDFDTNYALPTGQRFDQSDGVYGVRFGGGLEAPLSQRLFARLDYTYTDYQDYDVVLPPGTDNFKNSESLLRVGFGYRFQDLPGMPADADQPPARFEGFYAGVQGGVGSLDTNNTGPRETGGALDADRGSSDAAIGGLFGGYGVRLGNFYVGAEADASFGDATTNMARDPEKRVFDVSQRESFGAGGRVGYIFADRALVYARLGATYTRFDTRLTVAGGGTVDQDNSKTGIRFGGGIEVPASEHFFLRLDYSRITGDRFQVTGASGSDTFENSQDVALIGIGYRF